MAKEKKGTIPRGLSIHSDLQLLQRSFLDLFPYDSVKSLASFLLELHIIILHATTAGFCEHLLQSVSFLKHFVVAERETNILYIR
ncbi:MAG: hypothetical protein IBX72_11670 [Nitrospirae bacterium]|nr:hypothetical protein [Nitrospirota bacterium]